MGLTVPDRVIYEIQKFRWSENSKEWGVSNGLPGQTKILKWALLNNWLDAAY